MEAPIETPQPQEGARSTKHEKRAAEGEEPYARYPMKDRHTASAIEVLSARIRYTATFVRGRRILWARRQATVLVGWYLPSNTSPSSSRRRVEDGSR
jgi:hypothetical protein